MPERKTHHIEKRPVIAIIGCPNVGKSTLFNKLYGRRKAIVHDLPGVTRDRNEVICSYRNRSFNLIDTGGLDFHLDDPMAFQAQSKKAVGEADILLFLMNAQEGLTPADEEVYEFVRKSGKPTYLLINKTEGNGIRALNEFYKLGAPLYPIYKKTVL